MTKISSGTFSAVLVTPAQALARAAPPLLVAAPWPPTPSVTWFWNSSEL